MAKINKHKARIKLNETLNSQLDAMEDNSSLEVFMPKNSTQFEFYDMINDVIVQEELSDKKGKKVKVSKASDTNSVSIFVVLGLLSLFLVFVYFIWNILF